MPVTNVRSRWKAGRLQLQGDFVKLIGNGAAGWHVVDIGGIWAAEA